MGRTNIRSGNRQLLRLAGSDGEHDQAVLVDFQKDVHLIGRNFAQEEVDDITGILLTPAHCRNKWIRPNQQGVLQPGAADDGVPIPALHISQGLKPSMQSSFGLDEAKEEPDLAYLLVIQGRSAALCRKVRIFYSLSATTSAMLEEACYNYSTVFSAAILKADVPKLNSSTYSGFKKFERTAELSSSGLETNAWRIPIVC